MGGPRINRKQKLNIVKVPGNYNYEFRVPNWHDMPILYLELLENKDKVRPEQRNIDYEPNGCNMTNFPNFTQAKNSAQAETKYDIEHYESMQYGNNFSYPIQQQAQSIVNIPTPIPTSQMLTNITIHNDERPIVQEEFKYSQQQSQQPQQNYNQPIHNTMVGGIVSLSSALSNNPPPSTQPQNFPQQSQTVKPVEEINITNNIFLDEDMSKQQDYSKPKEEDPDIMNILRGDQDTNQNTNILTNPMLSHQPYLQQQPQQLQQSQQPQKLYPSLSEINNNLGLRQGGSQDFTFPNRNDEKSSQRKRELLFKFKILKKHYSDANIPEYNEFSDLITMEREYESLVKQLRIESNVENYKKYLIVGFGLIEFVLKRFLSFTDIDGFTQQQLLSMNQYEKILVEIGEKHQIEPSKQWSPELRLIGMIAMNAVIFIGTKYLFKAGSSSDILNIISGKPSMNEPKPPSHTTKQNISTNNTVNVSSKKMKGPSMDDIDSL